MAYSGPSLTIYPARVVDLTAGQTLNAWSNKANLIGAADGNRASVSVQLLSSDTSPSSNNSDRILLEFDAIASAGGDAEILSFKYTDKAIIAGNTPDQGSFQKGHASLTRGPVNRARTSKGSPEGSHEYPGPSSDFTSEGDYPNPRFIDSQTGFSVPSYKDVANLSDFGGLELFANKQTGGGDAQTYTVDFAIDALQLHIHITPGIGKTSEARNLIIASIGQVDADTYHVPIPEDSIREITFDDLTGMASVTATATASNPGTDTKNTTTFIECAIDAGALRHLKDETPEQLRIITVGSCITADSGDTSVIEADKCFGSVDEAVLAQADRTLLVSLTDSADPYDVLTLQIADDGWPKQRTICIDISGLTQNDIAALVANGLKAACRWNLNNPGEQSDAQWILKGIKAVQWVYQRPKGRTSRTARTGGRLGRMGRTDN